jgi:hypothetical protein
MKDEFKKSLDREAQLSSLYPPYSRLATRAREEGKPLQETLEIVFKEWRGKYSEIYSDPPNKIDFLGTTVQEQCDFECIQYYRAPDPKNIEERPSSIPKVPRRKP